MDKRNLLCKLLVMKLIYVCLLQRKETEIEEVGSFIYLGCVVSVNGGTEEDVASRIKKANGIFVQLHPVWRNHNILKGVKNMNIQYKCEVSIIICL